MHTFCTARWQKQTGLQNKNAQHPDSLHSKRLAHWAQANARTKLKPAVQPRNVDPYS